MDQVCARLDEATLVSFSTGEVTPSLCRSVQAISSGVSTAASVYANGLYASSIPKGKSTEKYPLMATLPRCSSFALGGYGKEVSSAIPKGALLGAPTSSA